MIEIIGIAIGMLLLSGICFFIADRFSASVFIFIPMVVLGTMCIVILIVVTVVVLNYYFVTNGLIIGN